MRAREENHVACRDEMPTTDSWSTDAPPLSSSPIPIPSSQDVLVIEPQTRKRQIITHRVHGGINFATARQPHMRSGGSVDTAPASRWPAAQGRSRSLDSFRLPQQLHHAPVQVQQPTRRTLIATSMGAVRRTGHGARHEQHSAPPLQQPPLQQPMQTRSSHFAPQRRRLFQPPVHPRPAAERPAMSRPTSPPAPAPLSKSGSRQQLATASSPAWWCLGTSRQEAHLMLEGLSDGAFLVRRSERQNKVRCWTGRGLEALMFREGAVKHMEGEHLWSSLTSSRSPLLPCSR